MYQEGYSAEMKEEEARWVKAQEVARKELSDMESDMAALKSKNVSELAQAQTAVSE